MKMVDAVPCVVFLLEVLAAPNMAMKPSDLPVLWQGKSDQGLFRGRCFRVPVLRAGRATLD
jgi:hypothetical protein